jgi:hypothetical protein
MLLFIAFMCFAVLFVSWLLMPETADATATRPVEPLAPETTTAPAHA